MVDAIDLLFVQHLADLFVQGNRRFVVVAERFLDDDAPPAVVLLHQARIAQLRDDGSEEAGSRGQIVKVVAARAVLFVDLRQQLAQAL